MISAILCLTIAVFVAAAIVGVMLLVADVHPNSLAIKVTGVVMICAMAVMGAIFIGVLLVQAASAVLIARHRNTMKARQNHDLAGFRCLDDISTAEKEPAKLWQAAKKAK